MTDRPTYEELEKRVQELERAEPEHKRVEEALRERLKELDCLQALARVIEHEESLERIFQKWVDVMPDSWYYPEIACARILCEGRQYQTENFRETDWRQSADLKVMGRTVGIVELCYLEERPLRDEGPFLKEERNLINLIGERLGRVIERLRGEEERQKLQARLAQAHKMEAIGTLAGGIAHDFNNILGVIIGCTELVLTELKEGGRQWENLNEAFKAAIRAKHLVKQILAFSRQAEQQPSLMRLDLAVREMRSFLRSFLPSIIEIKISYDGNVGEMMADPTQIHQVITNLCINASHAMREKGGVLDIDVGSVELTTEDTIRFEGLEPGNYCRLRVSDTGDGMDPATLNRVFDPYFTTQQKGKGTGLGLAVVHGIVKCHGGSIAVESQVGKGSTFEILFPRMDGRPSTQKTPIEEAVLPKGNGERLLVVDDEEGLVNVLDQMLRRLGYRVKVTTSSLEALELFMETPYAYDLVVTDMTMPQMTGLELANQLVRIRPRIPVVLCTGFSELIDVEDVETAGVRAMVMKPILMRDIAEAVRQSLEDRH